MTQYDLLSQPRRTGVTRSLSGLLLVFSLALGYTALNFRSNMMSVQDAQNDNRAWNIAQFEVQFQKFHLALINVLRIRDVTEFDENETLELVQVEFDIFFSRISSILATLRSEDQSQQSIVLSSEIETLRHNMVAEVDALTEANGELYQHLLQLEVLVTQLAPTVREATVQALQLIISENEIERNEVLDKYRAYLIASIILSTMAIASLYLSMRLGRSHAAARGRVEQMNAFVRASFDSSRAAILVCDTSGYIILANSAATEILGLKMAEMVGQAFEDVLSPEYHAAALHDLMHEQVDMSSDQSANSKILHGNYLRQDGTNFPAEIEARTVNIGAADTVLLISVRDITKQVMAEDRLRAAVESAQSNAAAQSRFLATMSHELRTPLHGVQAALDLLVVHCVGDQAKDLISIARVSAENTLRQIDFALDAIRGEQVVEKEVAFNPMKIASEMLDEFRLVTRHDQTIYFLESTKEESDFLVFGRPNAYRRALVNLVGNAAKFAPGGSVTVKLDLRSSAESGMVELSTQVIDDGPGILPEVVDKLFEPFQRLQRDNSSRAQTGFGLGLWITQQAVQMLGGEIFVQSALGNGCNFNFCITLRGSLHRTSQEGRDSSVLHALEGQSTDQALLSTGQALVVDDAEVNARLVAMMLEELGFDVSVANSGPEAVSLAMLSSFDLILMDFFMPDMNGEETISHIRLNNVSNEALIIGITARVDIGNGDSEIFRGVDAVLHKPFGKDGLKQTLLSLQKPNANAALPLSPVYFDDSLADILSTHGEHIGIPLLVDTINLAFQAADEVSSNTNKGIETAHKAAGAALMIGLTALGQQLMLLESAATERRETWTIESRVRELADLALEDLNRVQTKVS